MKYFPGFPLWFITIQARKPMSLAVLKSRALAGMDAPAVTVEVHLANGLPQFTHRRLAGHRGEGSRRTGCAPRCKTRGFEFPRTAHHRQPGAGRPAQGIGPLRPADRARHPGRVAARSPAASLTSTNSPASCRCRAIAAGARRAGDDLRDARAACRRQPRAFILPRANADEAALVRGRRRSARADHLLQVCAHFAASDDAGARAGAPRGATATRPAGYPDFSDVKGQPQAKRALEVAAAGGHSVLLVGPPGTGKSMLAARFAGLLPPMTDEEALESAAVQSLTGGFQRALEGAAVPGAAPHGFRGGAGGRRQHAASRRNLLAHCGVLFLDELPV